MENKMHETVLNFKCEKRINGRAKKNSNPIERITNKGTGEPEKSWESFGSPTPEKAPQPSSRRYDKKPEGLLLPDSFQEIADLFDGMQSSIKLLHLCRKPSTFRNVSQQVEILKKRKFLHNHLSQMKYIMPDLVHVEKIIIHDQTSLCMVPDLKVTLLPITVIGQSDLPTFRSEDSDSKALRNLFQGRLHEFFQAQREAIIIPQVALPEPFNSRCNSFLCNKEPSSVSGSSSDDTSSMRCASNDLMKHNISIKQDMNFENILDEYASSVKSHSVQHNLVHPPPTPSRTMSNVEGGKVPKGSQQKGSVSTNPRRSLNFAGECAAENGTEQNLQSNAGHLVDGETDVRIPASFQEMVETNENMRNMSYKGETVLTHRQMLLSVPSLVITICKISQSVNCNFITRQELLHKVLMYSDEVLEPSVIEGQLKVLEELVPEWISKTMSSTGDLLYRISKSSDATAILARLGEAS